MRLHLPWKQIQRAPMIPQPRFPVPDEELSEQQAQAREAVADSRRAVAHELARGPAVNQVTRDLLDHLERNNMAAMLMAAYSPPEGSR